ncbi:molybdopterin-dependent oxidoreductase [Streptomyces sp. HUAS YS2]|uniref:Molybdopterin-dependent oxidoreductase n=1 Tax=Streptomyces solicathayae TaxID=3081768 RepID=A0ABZ0LLU9_9ACTN|nr:molybdopterin-dependent oxidoreductase [Streptomyces sp. HUAS YS2]WOX20235.1 molybdopterin-dependent oxidoreductase [Streptomyces sp. HUAS YS2]
MSSPPPLPADPPTPTARLLASVAGVVAGYAALAVAELVAAAVRPEAGPVTAVGGSAIDLTPAPLKEWAIRTFGESDKTVLQLGILVVLAVVAVLLGQWELWRRGAGAAGLLAFGVIGAVAAATRPDAGSAADALPSLVGAAAGAGLLYWLVGRLVARPGAPAGSRRRFLLAAGATALAATGVAALGRSLGANRSKDAEASRADVRLPRPDEPVPPRPRGTQLAVAGISPFITPNKDFYRVDTALVVPKIDAARWRLRVHGLGVTKELTLTFQDLLDRPVIERDLTLNCVSNEVGGPYIGNARWTGVRLADLLRKAGVRPPSRGGPADQLVARSVDEMTIGTPVEDVMDGRDALLAFGMNGVPLPFTHGFPVRMLVPGLYGYVSACKWIEEIELTTFDAYDAYWARNGWAARAPVKTQSRIDTPRDQARLRAGTVVVAGVAWAQRRGIERVEVQVDEGPWERAELAASDGPDTWRQWFLRWRATPGEHTLTVRATDGSGETQTARRTGTMPDGATGRHTIRVRVE